MQIEDVIPLENSGTHKTRIEDVRFKIEELRFKMEDCAATILSNFCNKSNAAA
jgi:hypothetical protein